MTAKIAQSLHAVMNEVGYVQKTGKNQFHGYRYAGEADLLEKLRPAMLKHGLLLLPSVEHVSAPDEHGNVNVRMAYTLMHRDGDVWPEKIGAAGCGNDRAKNGNVGDKGVYKAITGANKYLLFKLFQIETGDDPENEAHEPPAPAPSNKLYLELVASIIKEATDPVELGRWWNDPDNRKQRADMLDDEEHASLKAECIAKIETLKAQQQAKRVTV